LRALNGPRGPVDMPAVPDRERPPSPQQRADRVQILFLLGRLVVAQPTPRAVRRTFVVLSIAND